MCMICQIGRSNAHDFTNGVINMSNDNQLHVYGGYFGVDMIIVCWATTTIFSCVNDVAREVMGTPHIGGVAYTNRTLNITYCAITVIWSMFAICRVWHCRL